MSFGKSKSKSGTPWQVRQGWVDNWADAQNVAGNLGAQPVAGANYNHNLANMMFRQNAGGPGVQNVGNAANMAGNLGMAAAGGNYNPMMAGAGSMPGQDMSGYMNPYTDQVIDRSMQDLARQRDLSMQGIGDRAAAAGAFGGSRHGVTEGEAYRGFADAAAQMAGGLRHQGFNTGAGLMQQDMNRALQAGMSNQNAHLQGMGLGLEGMNLGLTGANMMGQLGGQQFGMGQQSAQSLKDMGDFYRSIQQDRLSSQWNLPLMQQQIRNDALALGFKGNTSKSSGFKFGLPSGEE